MVVNTRNQVTVFATSLSVADVAIESNLASVLTTRIGENKPFGDTGDFAIVVAITVDTVTDIVTNFIFMLYHFMLLIVYYNTSIANRAFSVNLWANP